MEFEAICSHVLGSQQLPQDNHSPHPAFVFLKISQERYELLKRFKLVPREALPLTSPTASNPRAIRNPFSPKGGQMLKSFGKKISIWTVAGWLDYPALLENESHRFPVCM